MGTHCPSTPRPDPPPTNGSYRVDHTDSVPVGPSVVYTSDPGHLRVSPWPPSSTPPDILSCVLPQTSVSKVRNTWAWYTPPRIFTRVLGEENHTNLGTSKGNLDLPTKEYSTSTVNDFLYLGFSPSSPLPFERKEGRRDLLRKRQGGSNGGVSV